VSGRARHRVGGSTPAAISVSIVAKLRTISVAIIT